ncbi:asparaginase [Mucilaginibacter phyllosphaerae]|uniref:asparaginase n=1 Tax=Mucilaginibacter phyllosphaerae TaxID=1812349 RepID=A0A4Y8A9J3_9SPHI|nr:asparaginase [Mucilaginibacter phyllosphaerae]MBB3969738.1 L-asparaginase [Mucilaginibacter phyllosphaerae]TEW65120.1 asparaginase [Mucilaginibacter phyllosphaerae]GGH17857.1 L-asparaginase 1 [Mucilaginibacter phyllosphaerae]
MSQILIIYTGGTIGMMSDPVTKTLVPINFEQIMDNVPELEKLNCKIKVHSFEHIIDSSNMNPEIWGELATLIEASYDEVDGFVILHGSDTMAFTASALSFMLQNLNKPVIFTGSQLPISAVRTDAKENLMTSIEIAKAKKNDKSRVPEVCIYFDYKLFRGNRAFKYNSSKFEAFRSPNYPILAESGVHLRFSVNDIREPGEGPLKIHNKLVSDVAVLKLYPGISPKVVETILTADVRGIVMETFGAGNTTTDQWFVDLLKTAIDSGKVILDISQCKVGTVELGRYETSKQLKDIGVANGYDMTYEAAVTKMMYLLGEIDDPKEVKRCLEKDLRGELTES